MEERILKILEENCEEVIAYEGDNLLEDDIIDSFTIISIISDIEEEFEIEIDAKYVIAENFKNKESIIAMIKNLLVR